MVESILYNNEIGNREQIRCLMKSEKRLRIQRGVIAEPNYHCTGIGFEVKIVIAVKQRLEHGGGHDRLAGTGCSRQRKGMVVTILMPPPSGFLEIHEHVQDGVLLIIFERELHELATNRKRKFER